MTLHLGRALLILLCLVTEIQLHFKGAKINKRTMDIWNAIMPLFEA